MIKDKKKRENNEIIWENDRFREYKNNDEYAENVGFLGTRRIGGPI